MDIINIPEKVKAAASKYRAVLIVILTGFLLMALPERKTQTLSPPPAAEASDFGEELQQLLESIDGAGKVRLLLSEKSGPQTYYQSDEDHNGPDGDFRRDTVIVSGSDRQESGLIRKITAPEYRGAVVIAQGGDSPQVKLALKQAVSTAAGIGTDKITVLKMK